MKSTRRQFLQSSAMASLALTRKSGSQTQPTRPAEKMDDLDGFAITGRHTLTRDIPTPNFFEGMLLGNGDVGVCVVVRPDAIGFHIGKNDCWDIRLSDDSEQQVLPFADLLRLWQRASDEAKRQGKPDMLFLERNIGFFRDYTQKTEKSYLRRWPRPWPCGTIWLHWDARWVQPGVHKLNPANGVFTLQLTSAQPSRPSGHATLTCFVDWARGVICASTDAAVPSRL